MVDGASRGGGGGQRGKKIGCPIGVQFQEIVAELRYHVATLRVGVLRAAVLFSMSDLRYRGSYVI